MADEQPNSPSTPAQQAPTGVTTSAAKDRLLGTIAILVCLAFFAALGVLMFHDVPAGNKDLVTAMTAALGTGGFIAVVGYFFGSSASSRTKDDTINSLSK